MLHKKPLVINVLKEPERDHKQSEEHDAQDYKSNIQFEIASMRHKSIAIELSWTVREIFETCVVAGCTADGNDLKDLRQDIQEGEINIS
ncbi:hypothetical protein Bca101_019372 [Brassica carinata]